MGGAKYMEKDEFNLKKKSYSRRFRTRASKYLHDCKKPTKYCEGDTWDYRKVVCKETPSLKFWRSLSNMAMQK
eukprot:snap_masked-scaffold_4-processed-gene-5.60-mRNA-1 protein AED:1.00 eAED:1.00 QI:0/-1/0/0/-1/1/1/0/72